MSESPTFHITKSPVPIIWLDTSIITVMAQWKHELCNLQPIQEKRISWLYDQIYALTRAGKIICPLAEQEAEVWAQRKKWLDTIHSLTLGIVTLSELGIHDSQFFAAIKAFVANEEVIQLSYQDIFLLDPVKKMKEALSNPFYITVQGDILFGAEYQRKHKEKLLSTLNAQRERNVESKISFEKQLEAEYLGNLDSLLIQLKQFYTNTFDGEDDQFNATSGVIALSSQLKMWEACSGKSVDIPGLTTFYKSPYYRNMPLSMLSSNLYAKMMINKQPIRSGDIMDTKHTYTLMPYSDLFVTDNAMSTFLKRGHFDKKYKTEICYIGNIDQIDEFFQNL